MTDEEKKLKKKIYNAKRSADPILVAIKNKKAEEYRKRPSVKKRQKKWREENKERIKNYHIVNYLRRRELQIQKDYGLTVDEYYNLFLRQNKKCAICFKDLSEGFSGDKHIDHSHKSGKTRGILCRSCNLMLGFSFDSESILLSAIKYLKKHE